MKDIEALKIELNQMIRYKKLIETNGVCIKQQPMRFFQNPQDETAKSLLLEAYAKEIEKKTAEINALKERL